MQSWEMRRLLAKHKLPDHVKIRRFIIHFNDVNSDTYQHVARSCRKAGYAQGSRISAPVLKKVRALSEELFGDQIKELKARVMGKLTRKLDAKSVKIFSYEGMVHESDEYVDHGVQLKAATELGKILKMYEPDEKQGGTQVYVIDKFEIRDASPLPGVDTPDISALEEEVASEHNDWLAD